MREALEAFLISVAVSAIGAPVIYRLLLRVNSRQTISKHVPEHAAKQGTPTMGGLIILFGLLVTLLIRWEIENLGLVLLLITYALVGFFDDFLIPRLKPGTRGFSWMPKMALQIGGAAFAMWAVGAASALDYALGIFLILFFGNAYNFSDGMDGLSGGLGLVLSFTFISLILMTGGVGAANFGALAGAIVVFLFLNAPPAKVFMGDVGSMPIGAMFGLAAYNYCRDFTYLGPLVLLSMMMVAELVPVPLQVASAKLRKGKRLFPFRTPIHHGFQHAGWPETRVVGAFILAQIIFSAGALYWAASVTYSL